LRGLCELNYFHCEKEPGEKKPAGTVFYRFAGFFIIFNCRYPLPNVPFALAGIEQALFWTDSCPLGHSTRTQHFPTAVPVEVLAHITAPWKAPR